MPRRRNQLTQAARYERSEDRQGYRSGHYNRNLTTTSGDVRFNVPRLKGISFKPAIIEWYRRRESSVEEALIECIWPVSPCGGLLSGWQLGSDASLRPAAPCGRHPVGQQEIHEYEVFGDWPR